MDEKVRRRQTMACLELAKCNWILRVGKENAHHVGLTGEEVEDCASGFLYKKMKQGLGEAEYTQEQREKIIHQAYSWAKRYAIRLTKRRQIEVPDCDEN